MTAGSMTVCSRRFRGCKSLMRRGLMVVTQGGIEPLRGRSVGRRPLMEYWTYFSVNGVQLRRPLCPPGSTLPTTNRQEATRLEKEMIRAALAGGLAPRDPSVKLFAAVDDYLEAKRRPPTPSARSSLTASG